MASEWFEFLPGGAPTQWRIRWLSDHSPEKMSRRRRGTLVDAGGLRLQWSGTSLPPDVCDAGFGATLLSKRLMDMIAEMGLHGFGGLAVRVGLPDGTDVPYSLLVVTTEVSAVCFRTSERAPERLFVLKSPVIRGLDLSTSDAFILPAKVGLDNVLVSERAREHFENIRASNAVFKPLKDLEVTTPEPDHILC